MTETTLMPSIRGKRTQPRPASERSYRALFLIALIAICALALLAIALWPRETPPAPASVAPTPPGVPVPDAGAPAPEKDATPSLLPTILGARPSDNAPANQPVDPPRRRVARYSPRRAAKKHAAKTRPPEPGALLCTLPPNTLIAMANTISISSAIGELDSFYNDYRACGRAVEIAIERTPAGLVVNGFSFNRRPACFETFSKTVIQLDQTPHRLYAHWILPQGGEIRECPASQPLSTRSRKQRTPRQPLSPSPSRTESTTRELTPPPWHLRRKSSSDAWNASPAPR